MDSHPDKGAGYRAECIGNQIFAFNQLHLRIQEFQLNFLSRLQCFQLIVSPFLINQGLELQLLSRIEGCPVRQYPAEYVIALITIALSDSGQAAFPAEAHEAAALARQETAVAKAAEEEQARLLAMISHEIRTPIAVIAASTQSLEALDATPPPERVERYDRIRRAVKRLAVLLELVIVQARAAVARQPLTRSPIEPAALTAAVLDLLEYPPPRPLELDVPPDLPTLPGDAGLMRFALLNLVDNACKYSPAGTPVRIAVRAETDAGRPGIAWTIQDQGPGIPPGLEERIFEKYVRISEASGKAGLGLGLYLARHIAERHGGWLRPRPHPGPGACFVCWLPSQPPAPDAPDTPP